MIKYFLFLLLLTPILSYADNTNQPLPKEIIGNQKLPEEDLIPYGQEKQRLKYKYNIVTGLPSGLSKFALFSLGYNINGYFSVGISQNQNRQTSEDYSYYDGTKTLSKGVYTEAGSVPSQDYGNTQLIPKMGTNIFLHYYPLIKLDLPIYIPVYLGRSQGSTLINGSENGIFNPAYQMDKPSYPLPILH
ncbi:MAG TPA: hypothetical protein PKX55_17430, partial [Leptospiraceae bacterium]|nr:hypothetical protein [Leptospiraceae bacterium]